MPIKEISNIYESSLQWGSQVLRKNENILSDVKSKKFDLIVEIDLSKTKAKRFGIKVANKTIEYDAPNQTLLSKKVIFKDKEILKLRILVDWGQLEVFANDGVFSFTQQFAFTPERNDLEFFADGDVHLVSMEFHEIKRTWD